MVRASGNVPLKRAKDAWVKLYNADDAKPNLNPKNLSLRGSGPPTRRAEDRAQEKG